MELFKINYDKEKDIAVSFKIDEDFQFLYCKASGKIKKGSLGNNSADYLFGKICQYYFQTQCYILILDFSELEYEFGDRLRKSINFFKEIGRDEAEKENPILLIKPKDAKGINSILDWIKPKKLIVTKNYEEAIKLSLKLFDELMNE
ncbi:hypothetical protein [Psychroserpens algicola]|uniref:Uncharacterized protein n=1 Tax=Psychroserpens algicola TaxID=1719034 RepID=A0ABT0HD36_9FLAO|nr:hypothetical protein [Psychroserpens algicola]MCK8482269.1 hypothetical protein [Psychroserpens algicola]